MNPSPDRQACQAARRDAQARDAHRRHADLVRRIAQGFLAVHDRLDRPPPPIEEALAGREAAERRFRQDFAAFLAEQRQAFSASLAATAPAELRAALRRLRWAVWACLLTLGLTALGLIGLYRAFHEAAAARTPTAAQIELMLQGLEAREREPGADR